MSTITRRRASRTLAAGLTAALAISAMATQAVAAEVTDGPYAGRTSIDEGHVDLLHIDKVGGTLLANLHADATGELSPAEAVIHVKPSVAARTVGAGTAALPGWPALGATYYLLPQTNQAGQVFAGFGYELGNVASDTSVTWELTDVEGPGAFAMWQSGEEGPVLFLGSAAGAATSFTSIANHEHVNWGFTAEGAYTLTFAATVTEPGQAAVVLPAQAYEFYVGETLPAGDPDPEPDPDPSTVLTITGLPSGAHAHYHTGAVGSLTAVQTPVTENTAYQWFTRASEADEWTAVDGATSAGFGFVVATSDLGRQYKVALYDGAGVLVAESEPAEIDIDDHGNAWFNGPTISATLAPEQGALVMSVADEDRDVELSAMVLGPDADRWVATGDLGPITVTDTRAGNLGWSTTAMVRGFVSADGVTLAGGALGWTPEVTSTSAGQSVAAGGAVATNLSGGTGLGSPWKSLATSAAGASMGTAQLGADLVLEAPTTLVPGTYTGMVILTLI